MIRVENLVKKCGDIPTVDDISFEVAKGEIFAFLGPNGAGKTTTIKMLTTLLVPTSGKVELDGLDPAVNANEVRKRFGIVFQDPSLDSELTASENMELNGWPRKFSPRCLRRAIRRAPSWSAKDLSRLATPGR